MVLFLGENENRETEEKIITEIARKVTAAGIFFY